MRSRAVLFCISFFLLFLNFTGFSNPLHKKVGKLKEVDFKNIENKSQEYNKAKAIIIDRSFHCNINILSGIGLVYEESFYSLIKINSTDALNLGNFKIIVYDNDKLYRERLQEIEGYTYNLNNGVWEKIKLEKPSIYKIKLDAFRNEYQIKFPNVKVGSYVELGLLKIKPLALDHNPSTWQFESHFPTLKSTVDIEIPSNFQFKHILSGQDSLTTMTHESKNVDMNLMAMASKIDFYHYEKLNIPAIKEENFVDDYDDLIMTLRFELSKYLLRTEKPGVTSTYEDVEHHITSTWEEVDETLKNSEYYGQQVENSKVIEPIIGQFDKKLPQDSLLFQVYNYFQKSFLPTENYHLWIDDKLSNTFNDKKGNPGEINLLFYLTLKKLGFNCNKLVLGTQNNPTIVKEIPSTKRLNHTIVEIILPKDTVILDASSKIAFRHLPLNCLNRFARRLDGTKDFVYLKPKMKYQTNEILNYTLNVQKKNIQGTYQINNIGYAKNLESNNSKAIENYKNKIKSIPVFTEIQIDSAKTIATEEAETVQFSFNLVMDEIDENQIILNPFVFIKEEENVFVDKKRKYPINMVYPISKTKTIQFNIPQNYVVSKLPSNTKISLPNSNGSYISIFYGLNNETNTLNIRYKLVFNKYEYFAEEYEGLKKFYEEGITKENDVFILSLKK